MNLQTPVTIPSLDKSISYKSRIMLIGSCFTENMGANFKNLKFMVDVNPTGIVYNPISVSRTLYMMLRQRDFSERDLLYQNGLWVSLGHHGSFSSPDKEACLSHINERLHASAQHLLKCDYLIITFGTAWVYRYKASGAVVANCHKFPASDFERFRLSPEDVVMEYDRLIISLRNDNPNLKIIFTVSPIRHLKDTAHGNQLSKAVLMLAIEKLCEKHKDTFYFPAYELVMDELRDYRFYADDMVHPSSLTESIIWERFKSYAFDEDTCKTVEAVERVNRSLAHRPINPDNDTYKKFRKQLLNDIEDLEDKYDCIDFSSEKAKL